MRTRTYQVLRSISIAAVALTAFHPAVCTGASGKSLISESTHVAIGTATSLAKVGTNAVFHLEIEKSLLGALRAGETISVECDTGTYQVQWSEPAAPQRGIYFLKEAKTGPWKCLRIDALGRFGYLLPKFATSSALSYDESADPLDKVVLEMGAAAMEALKDNPHSYLVPLTMDAAFGHDSPNVRRLFRAWMQSPHYRLKIFGLAQLIRRGDTDAFNRLLNEVDVLQPTPETGMLVSYLDENRDPVPEKIAVLGQLATSQSRLPGIQKAAARALRFMHTRDTLPHLAALLDSTDPNLQAEGVLGLAFFANGVR